ncbi:MAG TPA: sulfatase-like hydrolase/transferase, partial [Vicinamibacterales bacterium]|nr:sulfatase-like hydrolase/transferase [Vicinamibacterales bacterium]
MSARWLHGFALGAALLLLDVSLTFTNVWPTPAISWRGQVSPELAAYIVCTAIIGATLARRRPNSARSDISTAALRLITIVWVCFVIGRYADVTAAALFGRDINLYWDLRFIPDVASLLAKAAHVWLVLGVILVVALVLTLLFVVLRWALAGVTRAAREPSTRLPLAIVSSIALLLFAAQLGADVHIPGVEFARPVTLTYARQIGIAVRAMTGKTTVPPSPPMTSDLARVQGADVYLVFLESYGAVTYDRPEFAANLASARKALEQAIRDSNRSVVSAFVESPTFGGNSWLAHISLMSGVEVRDPDVNAMLMAQKRETMVTAFSRQKYRTVALMPGLWQAWPEGSFYHFDTIYGGERLDYRGPEFGWFDIPDEFALAKFDELEARRTSRAPLFMFFPTISTHTPFRPTPPYQPDWTRMLTAQPFDQPDLDHAFDQQADWLDLGPSYVDAMAYTYATLSGYLRRNADRDVVLILLGDHQPPALVSGEGAPWDVPVHVIASRARRDVLDQLVAKGFRRGLTPARPDLS